MFRDKEFLIEQGMSDKCRNDIFYFVGAMYDEVKATHEISEKRYKEIKNYLEKNRDIIGGKEYSLGLYQTVCKRFRESFDWGRDIKVIWEEEKKKERERNAAQLNEESGYGVYGIYVNNILVYIGETTQSFRERFMEHRNYLLKEDSRKLYSYLNQCKKNNALIEMIPLIDVSKVEVIGKKKFSEMEIKCMEFALITYLKPKLNISGVCIPYRFN